MNFDFQQFQIGVWCMEFLVNYRKYTVRDHPKQTISTIPHYSRGKKSIFGKEVYLRIEWKGANMQTLVANNNLIHKSYCGYIAHI